MWPPPPTSLSPHVHSSPTLPLPLYPLWSLHAFHYPSCGHLPLPLTPSCGPSLSSPLSLMWHPPPPSPSPAPSSPSPFCGFVFSPPTRSSPPYLVWRCCSHVSLSLSLSPQSCTSSVHSVHLSILHSLIFAHLFLPYPSSLSLPIIWPPHPPSIPQVAPPIHPSPSSKCTPRPAHVALCPPCSPHPIHSLPLPLMWGPYSLPPPPPTVASSPPSPLTSCAPPSPSLPLFLM